MCCRVRTARCLTAALPVLWALWLWTAPLPPLCPLPQQENLRYGSADIRNPAEAAWSFAISAGQLPQCFGSLKPAARDGWTVYAAQMLRPHAYRTFDAWRKAYAVLLLLFSGCLRRCPMRINWFAAVCLRSATRFRALVRLTRRPIFAKHRWRSQRRKYAGRRF